MGQILGFARPRRLRPPTKALLAGNELVAQTIRERILTLADIARNIPPHSALVDFIQCERYDFAAKTSQWKDERYSAYMTFPLAGDSTNVTVQRGFG